MCTNTSHYCWGTNLLLLYGRFNADIFGGRLPADLEISWNNNLKTTAGLTHYKRQILPDPSAPPLCAPRP